MQSAMNGLWFKQVIANDHGGGFALNMDQATLALSTFNPADALRLLTWVEGECLDSEDAAAICEAPENLFYAGAAPTMSREKWERALGRLALCLFASMRNEWRFEHGRDASEMEDVLTAPADFFAVLESGFKYQIEQ